MGQASAVNCRTGGRGSVYRLTPSHKHLPPPPPPLSPLGVSRPGANGCCPISITLPHCPAEGRQQDTSPHQPPLAEAAVEVAVPSAVSPAAPQSRAQVWGARSGARCSRAPPWTRWSPRSGPLSHTHGTHWCVCVQGTGGGQAVPRQGGRRGGRACVQGRAHHSGGFSGAAHEYTMPQSPRPASVHAPHPPPPHKLKIPSTHLPLALPNLATPCIFAPDRRPARGGSAERPRGPQLHLYAPAQRGRGMGRLAGGPAPGQPHRAAGLLLCGAGAARGRLGQRVWGTGGGSGAGEG